jgi:hypothetical protein
MAFIANDLRHHVVDEQGQLRVGGELRQLHAGRDANPLQVVRQKWKCSEAVHRCKLLQRSYGQGTNRFAKFVQYEKKICTSKLSSASFSIGSL